jgi:hypothetical protein
MQSKHIQELTAAEMQFINGGDGSIWDRVHYAASYAVGYVVGVVAATVQAALTEPQSSATVSVVK